jgi:ElaB/YqjD/DUF883 family membrane-anchored ribosome-binding protein
MVNQQVLTHHWDDVRSQLCEKWKQLTEDDLPQFPGNVDQLIGRIHQKTGVARETIEAYLATLTEEGQEAIEGVQQRVRQAASSVASAARQGSERARERLSDAEEVVRNHPTQALITAFGAGLVCGMGIAMMLRGSQPRRLSRMERSRAMLSDAMERGRGLLDDVYERGRHMDQGLTGRVGRQLRDSLSSILPHR